MSVSDKVLSKCDIVQVNGEEVAQWRRQDSIGQHRRLHSGCTVAGGRSTIGPMDLFVE